AQGATDLVATPLDAMVVDKHNATSRNERVGESTKGASPSNEGTTDSGSLVTHNEAGGGYEVQRRKRKTTACCFQAKIEPAAAADDGCKVTPAQATQTCGTNLDIEASAGGPNSTTCRNWIFKEWSGAASGSNRQTQVAVTGKSPQCTQAVAHYDPYPILNIHAAGHEDRLCIKEAEGTRKTIANLVISVNEAADWQVTRLKIQGWGTGDDRKDVAAVRLYRGNSLLATAHFAQDNGALNFPVNLLIPKGTAVTLRVEYEFVTSMSHDFARTYGVSVKGPWVTAQPVEPPLTDYEELPENVQAGSPPLRLADVWDTSVDPWQEYDSIQKAVDGVGDVHHIGLCPWVFQENVIVESKSLYIEPLSGVSSLAGQQDSPVVQAKEDDKPVFSLKHSHVTLRGLDIQYAHKSVGVEVSGQDSHDVLTDCLIHSNETGVLVTDNASASLVHNIITDNSENGVVVTTARGYELKDNTISGNEEDGVHIQGDLSKPNPCDEVKISGNFLRENKQLGLNAQDALCGVFTNNHILSNEQGGVSLALSRLVPSTNPQWRITHNVFDKNDIVTLKLDKLSWVTIADNEITGSETSWQSRGIVLEGSTYIDIARNTISHNVDGVFITQDSRNIHLQDNRIESNRESGLYMKDYRTEEGAGVSWGQIEHNVFQENGEDDITLFKVSGLFVEQNELLGHAQTPTRHGIYAQESSDIFITDSKIANHGGCGIYFKDTYDEHIIQENDLTENNRCGIKLEGYAARQSSGAVIRQNTLDDNSGAGIQVQESQGVSVEGNTIIDTTIGPLYLPGVSVTTSGVGIFVYGGRSIILKDNTITQSDIDGIRLSKSVVDGTVQGNVVRRNGRRGILVDNNDPTGRLNFVDNVVEKNKFEGMRFISLAHSQLSDNTVSQNESEGIQMENCDDNVFKNNTIQQNHLAGIRMTNGSDRNQFLKGNRISQNDGAGIAVEHSHNSLFREVVLEKNQSWGFEIEHAEGTTIDQCTLKEQGATQIYLKDVLATKVLNSTLTNGLADGIYIEDSPVTDLRVNRFRNLTITGHKSNGVTVERADSVYVMNSRINNNADKGVAFYDSDDGDVVSNDIIGNCTGLYIEHSSVTAVYNNISDSLCLFTGVHVQGGKLDLHDNSITRNKGAGLWWEEGATGQVSENKIADNGSDGVRTSQGAEPQLRRNNIMDNGGYALNNQDPTVTIDAQENWWGDAAGPAQTITGTVDTANWLTSPVDVLAAMDREEVIGFVGHQALNTLNLNNLAVMTDTLRVSATASQTWAISPTLPLTLTTAGDA
ncbi:MAG: hypothetical protein GXP38_10950, partial [Chloroflexi bacterium]|nr:hypothetical protein [Chloroflexota bacterium]